MAKEDTLVIHEIYSSIQGESTFAGLPCTFVRTTGCNLRCTWCDTPQAFYGGTRMRREEVLAKALATGTELVELTGGEPLLQPGALTLLARLCDSGYEVLLETGGGRDIAPVDPRVRRIVDVKCPDSGEAAANRWENLEALRPHDELKFVVASEADYRWASRVIAERRLAGRCPIHLSPVHGAVAAADLAAWILRDRLPVRLTLQVHKLLWGPEAHGV